MAAGEFIDGVARVSDGYNWFFIDKDGRKLFSNSFDYVEDFSEGLARFEVDNKWGYIDKMGRVVLDPILDSIFGVNENLFDVSIGGKTGFLNIKNRIFLPIVFDDVDYSSLSDDMLVILNGGKCRYLNTKELVVISSEFDICNPFDKGLALVKVGDFFRYINTKGKQVGSALDLSKVKKIYLEKL